MSVWDIVLLIFWGISCILITVQIIKIRKEKARIPDKDKNLAKFMVGMIAKLRFVATILPGVFSEGTKYACNEE